MKKFTIGLLVMLLSLFITGCGCEKQTVNVTFDTDGGSSVEKLTIKKGEKLDEPEVPYKAGYTFDGWYYNGEKYDFSKEVDGDITLEARWKKVVGSDVVVNKVDFTLSKKKVTLTVGNSTTIKVTTDSKEKATWKSSNEKIVIVKNGKITAKSEGKATITVTIGDVSKTINVTVVKKSVTTTTTTKVAETTTKKFQTTTTTAKKDVISWILPEVEGSKVGQAILYLTKNGEKVAGTCTIITKTGETVDNFEVGADGYPTNTGFIKDVINIKIN